MTKKVVRTSEEKALLDFQSRPKVMFNQGENRFVGLNPEDDAKLAKYDRDRSCLLYTSPSPRDGRISRMPSSA